MQLKLVFTNNHVTIELTQHPTIQKWFNFFQDLTGRRSDYYRMFFSDENRYVRDKSFVDFARHWKTLLDSFEILQESGYQIPFALPGEFDFNQLTLNRLHRFFTYNCEWWYCRETEPNPFDKAFVAPSGWDLAHWYSIIGPINESVHELELCTPTATKQMYKVSNKEPLLPSWVITNSSSVTGELIQNCYLPFDSCDQSLNYQPMDFSRGAPVTLNASILGKCMLQSYFEEDDPTAQDARGREGSYGGFCIHLNKKRQEIYQSNHFRQWAASYGRTVDSLPLEFQIGYVSKSSCNNLFHLDPQQYIRTEFVN